MNKYEIHFKYNEEDEMPEGYSIVFTSNVSVTDAEDIIQLAKSQKVLDENDLVDLEFVDYAIKL